MRKFIVSYRTKRDNPDEEVVFASYEVQADSIDQAKEVAAMSFRAEYPELFANEFDIDTQWQGG